MALVAGAAQAKDGISFVVMGDFGNVRHMRLPNQIFDDIDSMKRTAKSGSAEDFDFFLTVGDNIYPSNVHTPSTAEWDAMLGLFSKRSHIKDLPIYPVRGNHDCYVTDMDAELKLHSKNSKWEMSKNYYLKEWSLNNSGDKFSLLALDSCFYLCESVRKNEEYYLQFLDEDSKNLYSTKCGQGAKYQEEGNKMLKWVEDEMKKLKSDSKSIWKATTAHHPMWGIHESDIMHIADSLLPWMKDSKFDAYFAGHEHITNYAVSPDKVGEPTQIGETNHWVDSVLDLIPGATSCKTHYEWFP